MNLKFKILWFEDEKVWFEMEKTLIQTIFDEHELIVDISYRDGENFDISELTSNDYDLIFMDYKLASDKTGDSIIEEIRGIHVLTDILFYSSDEENMLSSIKSRMKIIEGVYFAKRDVQQFEDKAKRIIEKIIKRSEDIVNLRGFVLDNTSGFETRVISIIDGYWNKLEALDKEKIYDTLRRQVADKREKCDSATSYISSSDFSFSGFNSRFHIIGMTERLCILQRILSIFKEKAQYFEEGVPLNIESIYMEKIGTYRNKLSHIKSGDNTIQVKGKDIIIDQNLHRLLRKNIKEIDSILEKLEAVMK